MLKSKVNNLHSSGKELKPKFLVQPGSQVGLLGVLGPAGLPHPPTGSPRRKSRHGGAARVEEMGAKIIPVKGKVLQEAGGCGGLRVIGLRVRVK